MFLVTKMRVFLLVVLLNAVAVSPQPDCNCLGFGDTKATNGSRLQYHVYTIACDLELSLWCSLTLHPLSDTFFQLINRCFFSFLPVGSSLPVCAVNELQCCSSHFIQHINNNVKSGLDTYLREEYKVTIRGFLDGVSDAFECKCLMRKF